MTDRELTEQPAAGTLRCIECATTSTDGLGWGALLTVGDERAEDDEEVAIFCSTCAEREFDAP